MALNNVVKIQKKNTYNHLQKSLSNRRNLISSKINYQNLNLEYCIIFYPILLVIPYIYNLLQTKPNQEQK
ncbi:MAG: hypothetical protein ACI8RY_001582 [Urechidicola sp.]|jgi:hypothetical protein